MGVSFSKPTELSLSLCSCYTFLKTVTVLVSKS